MLPKINPNQNAIAIDLETCDPELSVTAPGYISKVGFVAGIAIKSEEGSWYLPVGHTEGKNYDLDEVRKWLNEKVLCGTATKVFHNGQYDIGWLKYIGVQFSGRVFDTMLAAPLLNENRFSYQLDSLGKIYCGEGKYEEGLRMEVSDKFGSTRTKKTIIRLKEDSPIGGYAPFVEAKARVSQFYDLWPKCVQDRYEVLGYEKSKSGQELFLVPTKRDKDIKALLWAIDPEAMGTYPIQDVELTYKLYHVLRDEINNVKRKDSNLQRLPDVARMEFELLFPLLEMREAGVRIDMLKAKELDIQYSEILNKLQTNLNATAGFPVNVNADTDLVKMCEKFGLKFALTEKGNPCFSSEMVPKDEFGLFDLVLGIRTYQKARDTYIRGYIFGCTLDGWLHGQYNQLKSDDGGTITGRLSSSNPNMQNLPNPKSSQIGKDIRGLFLPDNDNERWASLDYSGQEPKHLTHLAIYYDEWMRKIHRGADREEYIPGGALARSDKFRGRDADFHTAVAEICVTEEYKLESKKPEGEDFKKDVKAFRPKAKSIGLGVMYGSGNKKVAEEMTKKGCPMTVEEAKAIRDNIFKGVPFLRYVRDRVTLDAKSMGYVVTIYGRVGHFEQWEVPLPPETAKEIEFANLGFATKAEADEWYRENRKKYEDIREPVRAKTYKALNKYIQGSAADQTKLAMLTLYKREHMDVLSSDIYFRRVEFTPPKFKTQVHDEINISLVPGEDVRWYQHVMETCLPLLVEVVAEPVVCQRWSEAK